MVVERTAVELPRHRLRYTVLDDAGTVSFVGPAHLLKMFAASCAGAPASVAALLDATAEYDGGTIGALKRDLRIFDEHYTADDHPGLDEWLSGTARRGPFRVLDESTRLASMQPEGAGLILFNVPQRRIVQVQNSYANLRRQDRGRVRRAGKPTGALYRYVLPVDWAILP
ncbi:MAG: hypothetical protein H0U40_01645 [Chloroflexia bacterium]|nr:hypothetical protein [Chloroflexia bacterium]